MPLYKVRGLCLFIRLEAAFTIEKKSVKQKAHMHKWTIISIKFHDIRQKLPDSLKEWSCQWWPFVVSVLYSAASHFLTNPPFLSDALVVNQQPVQKSDMFQWGLDGWMV